jgi:hypothetical protein
MAERARIGYAAVGILVLTAAGWTLLHHGAPTTSAAPPVTTATVRVSRHDVTVRDIVTGTLGYLNQAILVAAAPGTLTWLPSIGAVVATGQRLYEVDGRPIILLDGARPAWRDFAAGMPDGPDIAQLEQNLAASGFGAGLTLDDHFSPATTAAIRRWQSAHRLPATGVIRLGDVVFRPGSVRIGALVAALGAPLSPGTGILTVSATTTAVTVSLDPSQQAEVHVGDPVSVSLPGGARSTTGTVVAVGAPVASTATADGSGDRAPGQGTPTAGAVSIPVTIRLDHSTAAGAPGIGPVQVAIASAEDRNVLSVPIEALLAAPGGGFQVAVHDNGQRRLVPVRTRLFDESDSLVEIDGVPEGTVVEVPAS